MTSARTRVLSVFALVAVTCVAVAAGVPTVMNYQGRLTNPSGVPIANTTLTVHFTIYEVPAGGTPRWADTLSVTTDSGGMFSALLGSVNPIPDTAFTTAECWLGIRAGTDPEMIQRTRLVSVPYSYRVKSVDGATGGTISGNTSIQSDLTVSGNVGIGTTSPAAKLDVLNGKIRASSQVAGAGVEFYPATAGTPTNAGSIEGVGGSTNIAIMPVGNVGIGTMSPSSKLDIAGDLKVSGDIIGSTPWTAFPFAAGYDNYEDAHGGGYQTVQYCKIGNMVYLRGLIHKADHGAIPMDAIFGTLPVGFRPPAILRFTTQLENTGVYINSSGEVSSTNGAGELQYFDGVFFSTSP